MNFKSIKISVGNFYKEIDFSEKVNLIYSKKNTVGKTTLLRLMLYAIGFSIPSTRKLKFEKCELSCKIESKNVEYFIVRNGDSLEVSHGKAKTIFLLPFELNNFLRDIFNTNNENIISNLLGAFYFDQEKGWTLLNRGTIIGKNSFNIEQLVRGLSDVDCSDLEDELKKVESNLMKYQKLFDIAKYKSEIHELKGDIVYDSYDDELEKNIALFDSESKAIRNELSKVEKAMSNNKTFVEYIKKMGISVKSKSSEIIPVNENTIIDYSDFVDILMAKKRIILGELSEITKKIEDMKLKRKDDKGLFKTENLLLSYENQVTKMDIDQVVIENYIKNLEERHRDLKSNIFDLTRNDNKVIENIYKTVENYANELEFSDYISTNKDFIFTSDLKSLSGAVFHKIVFSFKLAYIKEIEKKLGLKLPIIIDSPSGREVEQINIDNMIEILKRDFSENQIIIASINQYKFDECNIIELKDSLIDDEVKNN